MDDKHVVGLRKPDTKERVEQVRSIMRQLCNDLDIEWDEDATVPTLHGKPLQLGDIENLFLRE